MKRKLNEFLSKIDRRLLNAKLLAMPCRIHFEFIDFCNLNCIMCGRENADIPKSTGKMSFEEIASIEKYFDYASVVGFVGNGEPFLHNDILKVLKLVISHGAVPSVVSNFTLIDEEKADALTELGPSILMCSFDGGTKETFEKIRRGADFDVVMNNLKRINELKKKKHNPYPVINFLTCVMKENVNELSLIAERAAEVGASLIVFQNMLDYSPLVKDSIIEDQSIIENELKKASEIANKYNIRIDWLKTGTGIKERYPERFSDSSQQKHFYCRNIWEQLHIDIQGNVKPCCFWTEFKVGNIKEQSVDKLWNCEEIVEVRRQISEGKIPNDCKNCHILEIKD